MSAASGNTATETTVTGSTPLHPDIQPPTDAGIPPARSGARRGYIGRFAPSPTGPLHLGSLLAAVGSYVDARHHGGRWLVRVEDLDTTRVVPGCSDEMLRTLEAFGLHWDGEVVYQSLRTDLYAQALETLRAEGLTFECSCSRRDLSSSEESGYPGTCRGGPTRQGPTATRFRIDEGSTVLFGDRIQGPSRFDLNTLGDVIIRRRDGAFAYQLAVVVDDAAQGITDIVRGADLLSSTAWQIALQRKLRLSTPRYAHLPLIVETHGGKLSKSRRSLALDPARASTQLATVLRLLQQKPPTELERGPPEALLEWATTHWKLDAVQNRTELALPP